MAYGRWNVAGYDRSEAVRLTRSGINPLIAVLLASRNISRKEDIEALTKSDISMVSSPLLMKDMKEAAERVRLAIERKERVTVYGDYDVDGITASCVVSDYLTSRGVKCGIYIPERLEEGYGVKNSAIDTIKERGTDLIITVDCGITANDSREYAKSLGMDMVITDHHECGETLPEGPVVDPCRPDCPSPAKMLAGVGVAFKLICAVEGEEHTEELLSRYADLVAVGTIADVMPMTGENRLFVRRGLELIKKGARPGFTELCSAAGTDKSKVSVTTVGYTIAPRINAAGRLGGTEVAVKLLLSKNTAEASEYAQRLCQLNRERQRIEGEMLHEAVDMLKKNPPEGKPIVLASSSWHQGVAGIVASRVSDRFGLPTVMISLKDGVGRGSCRSCGGYNIYEALSDCRELLLNFGGHEMAAGLTVEEDKIDSLRQKLGEVYVKSSAGDIQPELRVDFEVIKPQLLTEENVRLLDTLEPYGIGNPQPILCMRDVRVENLMAISEGKHTKMWLNKNGSTFEAVFFSHTIKDLGAKVGGVADVAFSPQINEFRGKSSVQLCLTDYVVKN